MEGTRICRTMRDGALSTMASIARRDWPLIRCTRPSVRCGRGRALVRSDRVRADARQGRNGSRETRTAASVSLARRSAGDLSRLRRRGACQRADRARRLSPCRSITKDNLTQSSDAKRAGRTPTHTIVIARSDRDETIFAGEGFWIASLRSQRRRTYLTSQTDRARRHATAAGAASLTNIREQERYTRAGFAQRATPDPLHRFSIEGI
jgi:hypothetical protein